MNTSRRRSPAPSADHDRMVSSSDLRSAREAAELLGVSLSTITRWVDAGDLTPLRRDPLVFLADDLIALQKRGQS